MPAISCSILIATVAAILPSRFLKTWILTHPVSLCFIVIIGLPAATPKEHINNASFALGNFINGVLLIDSCSLPNYAQLMAGQTAMPFSFPSLHLFGPSVRQLSPPSLFLSMGRVDCGNQIV